MSKAVVISISIVILLLSSVVFYYSNQVTNPQDTFNSYNARKEDIFLSQQKIQESLNNLNQTIAQEMEHQKVLTDKVTELAEKADIPTPVINTTKVIQEPPKIVKIPAPTPVTRAS